MKLERVHPGVLLGLVIGVGVVLRLLYLTAEGFWFDEFCIWRQAHMGLGELYADLVASDVHPPLYQLVILAWSAVFGTSELALRMPSVLFGVLSIVVVYDIGRRLFDGPTALIAALFLALGRDAIYYSQEARSYSLLLLLGASTFWAWLRVIEQASRGRLVAYGGIGLLLAYTHVFGLLFLVFLSLTYGVLWRREARGAFSPRAWWVTHIAMGLLFTPWLPALLSQATRIQGNFWIDEPKPWFFAEYLYDYMGHWTLVAGIVVLSALAIWHARSSQEQPDEVLPPSLPLSSSGRLALLLAWLVFMFWVPYFISILSQPMMHSKSALMVMVPLSLLGARGVMAVAPRYRAPLVALWCVASLAVLISTVYLKQNREQWKDMVDAVAERYQPEQDLVVLYHPDYDYFYCYRYYIRSPMETFEVLCQGDACQEAVKPLEARADEKGTKRLWLLRIRAREDFPKGLEERWRVVEEESYHTGILQLLERK